MKTTYQKVLWRFDSNQPVQEYVLSAVTFGLKSSPFLANETMLTLADEYESELPYAAEAIRKARYMDDFYIGSDSNEITMNMFNQLCEIMNRGCFPLGKLKNNCEKIAIAINQCAIDPTEGVELKDESTSVLGLKWMPKSDCFIFNVKLENENSKITKRTIVSNLAKLYDPNGFLGPVIVCAKIIIRELWKQGIDWDEKLSSNIENVWCAYKQGLMLLNSLRIPRWIQTANARGIEIHGFADAAKTAMAANIYVRAFNQDNVYCNLIFGKTKISPLKTLSIEKLELCAAKMLAELMKYVREKCDLFDAPYCCFSDSTITLQWIKQSSSNMKSFVANRVSFIQTNTEAVRWRHIPTKMNPADIASRGCDSSSLLNNDLWWHGPSFLNS